MLLVVLTVTLGLVASSPVQNTPDPDDRLDSVEFPFSRAADEESLNDMFREVEELMEDSKAKLRNAVKEMEAEDKVASEELPLRYHNESVKEIKVGNDTMVVREEIIKETDNKTGATYISETIISSLKSGYKEGHECIVDEDCRPGNYCHLSSFNYKCLPCKEQEMCTRDGECCEGRLCVWAQCRTSSKGEIGTICESQQDCGSGLCCAVHTSLLFPVCTPMPGKGEQCQTLNPLLELFTWELEPEVPVNFCPCPSGLVCQPRSLSLMSVCEEPSLLNTKRDQPGATDEDLSFIAPAPQDDLVYDGGLIVPTGFGLELSASEDVIDKESELVPRPQFID
ncbi:dickkopf-related protein 3 [Rhinoderma darwinii]|uniref:dickkopf-related protein 3 n=1 Tax=Rhinoderma darwinii TaxID=43563 RepID=UPI003F66AF33